MPRDDLTAIAAVLDRSGSMQDMREDAMGGFNAFLKDQQDAPGEAELTVALFDHEYVLLHDAADIKLVKPLDETTYVPRGGTALYDALGRTVNVLQASIEKRPEDERPGKVIIVIVTDGQENSSSEFTRERVFEQLKKLKADKGWKVMFLAADQDALEVGHSLGVGRARSAAVDGTKVGARASYRAMNAAVRGFRSGVDIEAISAGGETGVQALYSQSLAADQGDGAAMSFAADGVGTPEPTADNTSDDKDGK